MFVDKRIDYNNLKSGINVPRKRFAKGDPKPQSKPGVQEIFDEFFGTYPFNEQQKPTPRPDWYDDDDTKNYINQTLKLAMADDDKDFFMKYLTPYYSKDELKGKSIIELNELLQGLLDRRILKRGGKV